jgi:hypothetical protein
LSNRWYFKAMDINMRVLNRYRRMFCGPYIDAG